MPKQKTFKITKDVDGEELEGTILQESIPVYEDRGWTVVDDGDSETVSEVASDVAPAQPQRQQPRQAAVQPAADTNKE